MCPVAECLDSSSFSTPFSNQIQDDRIGLMVEPACHRDAKRQRTEHTGTSLYKVIGFNTSSSRRSNSYGQCSSVAQSVDQNKPDHESATLTGYPTKQQSANKRSVEPQSLESMRLADQQQRTVSNVERPISDISICNSSLTSHSSTDQQSNEEVATCNNPDTSNAPHNDCAREVTNDINEQSRDPTSPLDCCSTHKQPSTGEVVDNQPVCTDAASLMADSPAMAEQQSLTGSESATSVERVSLRSSKEEETSTMRDESHAATSSVATSETLSHSNDGRSQSSKQWREDTAVSSGTGRVPVKRESQPDRHTLSEEGSSFSKTEGESVLRQLQGNSTKLLATSLEGIYGENKVSSLLFLCRILERYFFMDHSSVFLDIGSGRGLPNTVAAISTKVKASIGIEIDEVVFNLSLRNQLDFYSMLLPTRMRKRLDVLGSPGDCRIAFLCLDGVLLESLDPVTHVFSFDLAMPVFMIERFVTLFNQSTTAVVFVTFRRDLSEFVIDAEPVCQVPIEMVVSSEKHRATIFVKRSHLHRLTSSIPHIDEAMDPDEAESTSDRQGSSVDSRNDDAQLDQRVVRASSSVSTSATSSRSSSVAKLDLLSVISSSDENSLSRCSVCNGMTKLPIEDKQSIGCSMLKCARNSRGNAVRNSLERISRRINETGANCFSGVFTAKVNQDPRSLDPQSRGDIEHIDGQQVRCCAVVCWAQCCACQKWRELVGCSPEEKEELDRQTVWNCSMNFWDVRHADCSAPEDSTTMQEIPIEVTRWAQCGECAKWRALPGCSALEYKGIQRKDIWVCSMNVWDSQRATCDAAEELENKSVASLAVASQTTTTSNTCGNTLQYGNGDNVCGQYQASQSISNEDPAKRPEYNNEHSAVNCAAIRRGLMAELTRQESPEEGRRNNPADEAERPRSTQISSGVVDGASLMSDVSLNQRGESSVGTEPQQQSRISDAISNSLEALPLASVGTDDDHPVLFLPPVIISRCRQSCDGHFGDPLVPLSWKTMSGKCLVQEHFSLCCQKLKHNEAIISKLLSGQQEGRKLQQSGSGYNLRTNRKTVKKLIKRPKSLVDTNQEDASNVQRTGHLARLVARCMLPLVQQAEWAYLELSHWLSSSAASRKQQRSKQGSAMSLSKRDEVCCIRHSHARKRRKRAPALEDVPNVVSFSQDDVKKQRHKDMEDALDKKWQDELDLKHELINRGLWCRCSTALRQRRRSVRPTLLTQGQALVRIEGMSQEERRGAQSRVLGDAVRGSTERRKVLVESRIEGKAEDDSQNEKSNECNERRGVKRKLQSAERDPRKRRRRVRDGEGSCAESSRQAEIEEGGTTETKEEVKVTEEETKVPEEDNNCHRETLPATVMDEETTTISKTENPSENSGDGQQARHSVETSVASERHRETASERRNRLDDFHFAWQLSGEHRVLRSRSQLQQS